MRKVYPSDISREQFEQVKALLEAARKKTRAHRCFVRRVLGHPLLTEERLPMADLPSDFPKWRTVHHYFALWSTKPEDGSSLLEQALTKSGRRSPAQTGTQRQDELLHRCCTALEALEQNKKHLAAGFGKIPNASLISVYNLST